MRVQYSLGRVRYVNCVVSIRPLEADLGKVVGVLVSLINRPMSAQPVFSASQSDLIFLHEQTGMPSDLRLTMNKGNKSGQSW